MGFQRDGTADIKGVGVKLVTLGRVWVEDGTNGLFYADVQAASIETPRSGPEDISERRLKEILTEAIRRGAPAYNRGQVALCAQIYSDVARELLRSNVDSHIAALLQRALQQAETFRRDPDKAAWALRHAFDQILDPPARSSGSSSCCI